MIAQQDVTREVNAFYEALPFNMYERPADAAALIRKGNAIRASYPALDTLLRHPQHRLVLEVGCGIGWFANSVAHHYGARVHAVDLCTKALAVGREVSAALGVDSRVTFHQADLFDLGSSAVQAAGPFPIVNSLGVLHHTYDCRKALLAALEHVAERGFLHLGLYHKYGRQPFLDMFADQPEDVAFRTYRSLYPPTVTDETLLYSWFRDQALHPHETQHTVAEVYGWLAAAGFECVSTSINRFQPVVDWRDIFEQEKSLRDVSYRRNVVERTYYPGFFIVVARRV